MLVTFSCDAYENITFFGDVAQRLLQLMKHSGTVPGAILANDVPQALAHLEQALERHKTGLHRGVWDEDETEESAIDIAKRAIPMIALLNAATKAKCDVMWA